MRASSEIEPIYQQIRTRAGGDIHRLYKRGDGLKLVNDLLAQPGIDNLTADLS